MKTAERQTTRSPRPERLGKYQLIKRIASGGMAEIYLARVSGLAGFEKNVVVKRILPQLATDRQFVEMFLDEARIAATLQHPNIVQMYDIGAADDNYFIAMEYLHGEDVRSIMKELSRRKQPLQLAEAINIVIGVSAGLHYAHEKRAFDGKPLGIIHRDITPQNVIVTYDGGVKLVDFGIAKASNKVNETRYGTLKGKISYMSPEQCKGADIDRRSDVFALGILLYELTTNTRLYRGHSDFDVMKQVVEQPVIPPSAKRPRYPVELEYIVMKALEKNKDDRYQTAQELQAELEEFVRNQRLVVSTIALSSFMRSLFSDRLQALERASDDAEELARLVEKSGTGSDSGIELDMDDLEEATDADPGGRISTSGDPSGGATDEELAASLRGPRWRLPAAIAAVLLLAVVGWFASGAMSNEPENEATALDDDDVVAATSPDDAADAGAAAGAATTEPPDATVPTAGSVRIASSPKGATLTIDGEPHEGTTPMLVDELEPGSHEIGLSLDGHRPRSVTVTVEAGEQAELDVSLERKPRRVRKRPRRRRPAVTGSGELRIASQPSCEVIIDGKARGQTPLAGIELRAGRHRLQLVNSRFGIDETYRIRIQADKVLKKRYTFPIE